MPTYEITDPQTNKVLEVTGDSPPTEAELEELFASQRGTSATSNQESGLKTGLKDVANAIGNAAPVVGGILGGLGGTVVGAPTGPGAIVTGAAGTAAGTGTGIAFREGIQNLTGRQDQSLPEQTKDAFIEPAKAGAIDLATAGIIKLGSKALSTVVSKIVPMNATKDVFKAAFTIPSKIAERLELDRMASEMPLHGVRGTLDDMYKFAERVTGSSGQMSQLTRNLLGKVKKPIVMNEAITAADNAVEEAILVPTEVAGNAVKDIVRMVSPTKARPQAATSATSALDAWDVVQSLEEKGYNLMQKSTDLTPRPELEQLGQVYLSAADAIKSQIDNAQLQEGALEALKTEANLAKLREISPRLAKQFSEATSMAELRSISKPFVDLMHSVRTTKNYMGSPIVSAIRKFGSGPWSMIQNFALSAPVLSTTANVMAGQSPSIVSQGVPALTRAAGQVGRELFKGDGMGELDENGMPVMPVR